MLWLDENRKKVIVNELLYWKKSRMLPDRYCDYLLALYTEGSQPKEIKKHKSVMGLYLANLIFLLLIPISALLIYFTELSIILQTAILFLFIFTCIFFVFYFFRKAKLMHIPIISAALNLLMGSVALVSEVYRENQKALYAALVINCVLWLFAGLKLKFQYLWISGALGCFLIVISIFV
ncbi:hypothetical protein MKY20_09855 [Cytobacillus sp. FSL W8-0315]|uniref:hypothetical protein n=1 Tax=Cytobacillus TaxID=2675230 RepID=UPI002041FC2D|nr:MULTISPECIES: hypothetical protein [Cytobacillus]MCM3394095.1 hypothetical protein [Cytobacillus oceanisediminis]MDK7664301.1 hypothetical protein [Cytobacillus oceanisediminis]UQX54396.1 hypothetical protein M5V91_00275 [Cytobacillus pseudoceanisediminis]